MTQSPTCESEPHPRRDRSYGVSRDCKGTVYQERTAQPSDQEREVIPPQKEKTMIKEQPTEAEAFAEFLENREATCLLAECRKEGFRVSITFFPKSVRMVWTYSVTLYKHLDPGGWENVGEASGVSLLDAAKEAIAQMKNGSGTNRHQVSATSGDFVTSSATWVDVPGAGLVVSCKKSGTIDVIAKIVEALTNGGSNGEIGLAVDGIIVVKATPCVAAPITDYPHYLSFTGNTAPGVHTVALMVRNTPGTANPMIVRCSPNVPAEITVDCS